MVESPPGTEHVATGRLHVIRESLTMALYLAISLLAVLVALPPGDRSPGEVLGLVWGTCLGLLLAHVVAFRVTARLASGMRLSPHDRQAVVGQAVAAVAVASLLSLPLLLADGEEALDLVRLELAGGVGLVAYLVARRTTTRRRALLYALAVVVVAVAVAVVKNVLLGH